MVASSFVRWAGIASLAAAGLMLVQQISQLVFVLTMSQSTAIATHSLRYGLALVAMYALLIALTGLYAMQATAAGRLGLVGYLVATLGTLLFAGDWWYETFVAPLIAAQAPELLRTAPSGSILIGAAITFGSFALGWVLFGIATYRARVFPRGAAILMVIGGIVGILALSAPFQIPLALAVGWMGSWLLRSAVPDSTSPITGRPQGTAGTGGEATNTG
ncbi:MAG TPA: hypothetical protein VFP66_01660 [Candidatus Limnocylindrales bacterium]|nr:hypothetical protein [Candidatus Limnocylindrales bacterium]